MAKKIKNPHDLFFRESMSYPKVAREFFESYLPQEIKEIACLDTIQARKDTYVDKNLDSNITDILYSVEINGEEGYFYVLVEHMRTSDPLMPFRVLQYLIKVLEQHLKEHKGNTLPLILPIVLYNGARPYKHTTDIFKMFKNNHSTINFTFNN